SPVDLSNKFEDNSQMSISIINPRYWAIVPAAGSGSRFATNLAKQYQLLGSKTLVEHSLSVLINQRLIEKVILPLAADDQYWRELPLSQHEKIITCLGKEERFKSVYAGLKELAALGADEKDWVIVHDAVRPCLSSEDLQLLIDTLADQEIG